MQVMVYHGTYFDTTNSLYDAGMSGFFIEHGADGNATPPLLVLLILLRTLMVVLTRMILADISNR